jgi:4-hydroxyacetophenone monooxygenase
MSIDDVIPDYLRTEPIVDSDSTLEANLNAANVLALTASAVQITGDPSLLHGKVRPRRFVFNEFDGGLTKEEQTELRRAACAVAADYRDGGSVPPPPPGQALARQLMDWMAAEHVPDDYAEMFLEEMDLAGTDPRRIEAPRTSDLSVVVIGAGMSGLLAGVRLKQARIPFQILEKNAEAGGTWLENTYPGCRVDVPNHYYCYSVEPNHQFSEFFVRQPELHAYFRTVLKRHGLDVHVRWRTAVERLDWDDDANHWQVTTRGHDGRRARLTATAVISAVGQLNRPYIPDLPHLDRFAGPAFHSACWDHSVELGGKRVGLIGAGASGFQIGPAIADEVDRLVIFQRTPQWIMPNRLYHEAVEPGAQWAMRHLPGYARWYRFLLLWQATDKMLDVVRVDPDWPGLPCSANARSERFRERIVRWINEQIGDNPELVAKVVPNYPPLGKRLLQDDGSWLRCLSRPNVALVSDAIDDIDEGAVIVGSARYEVDVIVLATGFRANEFLYPMEIAGREGRSLHELWGGKPAAYLGITVPGFPNLFLMYGPGTNLAHAGSVIFQAECQMRYIGECLSVLAGCPGASLEPTVAAFEDYVERWQRELSTTVWAHRSVEHSWYKAADGQVYVLSPWRLVDYWRMTAAPDPDAHLVHPGRDR